MGSKVAPWEGQMGFKASSAWLKLSLNQQWLWQRWKLGHRGCVKVKVAQSCPTLCKPLEMGKQWKQCHFLFWAPKSDGDCSHEIKRRLLVGRKVMTNLDSIFKSRDVTLPRKVHLVQAMVFPVVMYGRESWMVKKAESRRIDAFEPWYWRRLLRVPWTARRSSQSILKEISPGCSLEGLMLQLKLQYFGHLM